MPPIAELESAARACEEAAAAFERDPLDSLIRRAREAAQSLEPSWSGSWAGYQARCYWGNFEPAQEHFSLEWGILGGSPHNPETYLEPTNWREYPIEQVHAEIYRRARAENLDPITDVAHRAEAVFALTKREILTTLDALLSDRPDSALKEVRDVVSALEDHVSSADIVRIRAPRQVVTRDRRFEYEGIQTPPHIGFEAEMLAAISHGGRLKDLAASARGAALYLKKRGATGSVTVTAARHDRPWDLWAAGIFSFGVLVGKYGGSVLTGVHHEALRRIGDASPLMKFIGGALSVGLALTLAGVATNLVASRIDRDDGILRAVLRSRRVRVLFFVSVLLAALAHALSQ